MKFQCCITLNIKYKPLATENVLFVSCINILMIAMQMIGTFFAYTYQGTHTHIQRSFIICTQFTQVRAKERKRKKEDRKIEEGRKKEEEKKEEEEKRKEEERRKKENERRKEREKETRNERLVFLINISFTHVLIKKIDSYVISFFY